MQYSKISFGESVIVSNMYNLTSNADINNIYIANVISVFAFFFVLSVIFKMFQIIKFKKVSNKRKIQKKEAV
jgi:hypothetical protein